MTSLLNLSIMGHKKETVMFKQSAEYRYFNAYLAWKAAKNPKFKEYWEGVMEHFRKEFN